MRNNLYLSLVLCGLLCSFCACPYRISARHELACSRIYVTPFENRTTELLSGHTVSRAVKEGILRRTSAAVSRGPDNAAVLKGTISNIGRDIISEDISGNVVSERLSIQINVTIEYPNSLKESFNVIGVSVYEQDSLTARDVLVREALFDGARRIVDRLIRMEKQ